MKRIVLAICLALLASPLSAAPTPLPLFIHLTYRHGADQVDVKGAALPGTVVAVRGASKIANRSGAFALTSRQPLYLVAVHDRQIRRFSLDLPKRAEEWLSWMIVDVDLTRMKAHVVGTLTQTSFPEATILVHHAEADKRLTAKVVHGSFGLWVPLVPMTNTLEWIVQIGWQQFPGPALVFTVQ